MLAPQFSLRRLLAGVTVCAFACLVIAAAFDGALWAVAVSLTLAWLVVTIGVYGGFMTAARVQSHLLQRVRNRRKRQNTPAGAPVNI